MSKIELIAVRIYLHADHHDGSLITNQKALPQMGRLYCRQGEPSQLFKRGNSMGANFQTMTLPGTTSRDEVTRTFSRVQDRDRSQNDSQYAGGFGMCSGLILTDYNFHIRRTAEAYLVGRSQKWDHALAVKYDTSEGQNWLIGAWCAEPPRAPVQ
jgi:hypothetical protein